MTTVIGPASSLRHTIITALLKLDQAVVLVDTTPSGIADKRLRWLERDILTADLDILAADLADLANRGNGTGRPDPMILLPGLPDSGLVRPWSVPYHLTLPVARLLPLLGSAEVTLLSSLAGYLEIGTAGLTISTDTPVPLPVPESVLEQWCDRAVAMAAEPCPESVAAPVCAALVRVEQPERWAPALSYRAAELILQLHRPAQSVTRILRAGEIPGHTGTGVVATVARQLRCGQPVAAEGAFAGLVSMTDLVRATVAPLPAGTYHLTDTSVPAREIAAILAQGLGLPDSQAAGQFSQRGTEIVIDSARIRQLLPDWTGAEVGLREFAAQLLGSAPPIFSPPLEVVIPPRPETPVQLARRQEEVYRSGKLKYGGPWTGELTAKLAALLGISDGRQVILTSSGTAALRLMVAISGNGVHRRNPTAVLPSFTFAATAEFLRQLGYTLVYCDVDAASWTMSSAALRQILAARPVDLVVSVDALGNPADYLELNAACQEAGVPLVADSAPSIGARYQEMPVGSQASAHAFSMSFAKVISAGGAGGFAILPASADLTAAGNWLRSSTMPEINAVVALDQLDQLDALLRRRRAVAARYNEYASGVPSLVAQQVATGNSHAYVHWVARIQAPHDRDRVAQRLARLGVATKPYYAPPLHDEVPGDMPDGLEVTRQLDAEVLALPTSSEMTASDTERVISALNYALLGAAGVGRC